VKFGIRPWEMGRLRPDEFLMIETALSAEESA
jgi:hypothetical protein